MGSLAIPACPLLGRMRWAGMRLGIVALSGRETRSREAFVKPWSAQNEFGLHVPSFAFSGYESRLSSACSWLILGHAGLQGLAADREPCVGHMSDKSV